MKYLNNRRRACEDTSYEEAAVCFLYAGVFIWNFICKLNHEEIYRRTRNLQRLLSKPVPDRRNRRGREYIWYLIRVRTIPFLVLLGLAFTKIRKAASIAFIVWTGFSGGMLLSMGVLGMGIKGSILCIVGILPQFLLYIPAYMVVIWYSYTYPQNKWNAQKSIFVGLAMTVGIILEAYVNPILMQAFLKTL